MGDNPLVFYGELVIASALLWMATGAWNTVLMEYMKNFESMKGKIFFSTILSIVIVLLLTIIFDDNEEGFVPVKNIAPNLYKKIEKNSTNYD